MGKIKKVLVFLFSFFALFAVILSIPSKPEAVHADTGPKPDFQITLKNLEKSDYIIGFGIKGNFSGPYIAYDPIDPEKADFQWQNVESLNKLFYNVELPDGWNLLEISLNYKDTTEIVIKSGYRWPSDFILIIYNELTAKYYLTEETQTYEFHSYFSFDMNNYKGEDIILAKPIVLEKTYEWGKEVLGFFVRLLVTLVIELGLAWFFMFTKKSFLIILITNVVTQVGLNVGLTLFAHFHGVQPILMPFYLLIEAGIMLIEAIIFKKFCKRGRDKTNFLVITYTVLANVLSFVFGIMLWFVI